MISFNFSEAETLPFEVENWIIWRHDLELQDRSLNTEFEFGKGKKSGKKC